MYGRSSVETIGYVSPDGETFCPDHGQEHANEEGWSALILDQSATDMPLHCLWLKVLDNGDYEDCGVLIRSDLTVDGLRYVLSALDRVLSANWAVSPAWWEEWGSQVIEGIKGGALSLTSVPWLSAARAAYMRTALWCGLVNASGESLSRHDYTIQSIDKGTQGDMAADLLDFVTGNLEDVKGLEPTDVGHAFWLNRNRHGAGFWDLGLGERGDRLSDASKVYGESTLFVGADGSIYAS